MSEEEGLKENIRAIQGFTDEQLKTYRAKISSNYLSVSKIIDFIKKQTLENNQNIFQDTVRTIKDFKDLFMKTITVSPSQAERTTLSNSVINLNNIIKEYEVSEIKEISSIGEALKNFKEEKALLFEEIKTIQKEAEESKTAFENSKQAFKEANKFNASKNYWRDKKVKHFRTSVGLVILFLLMICAIFYSFSKQMDKASQIKVIEEVKQIVIDNNNTHSIENSKTKEDMNFLEKYNLSKYIYYFLLLSLYIWVLRIVLKLLFSNLHLSEEAHEKETMISTYLALISEGAGLEEKDKSLILEAIFRPSSNGLIKDETNVTLLDAIKALKDK